MVSIGSTDITLQIIVNSLRCLAVRNMAGLQFQISSQMNWQLSFDIECFSVVLLSAVLLFSI